VKKIPSSLTFNRIHQLQENLRAVPEKYYGSSFYLFSETALAEAAENFENCLPGVTPFYAIKANDRPEILSFLAHRGWSFDAASAAEVYKLAELGVSGERIILANPFKDKPTVESILNHAVCMTTADSPEELQKLARAFANAPHQPKVLIRITLPSEGVQTDLGVKFGCPPIQAVKLLEMCLELGLKAEGISFHVGTQSWNPENYARHLEGAIWVLKEFAYRTGLELKLIDIGGGFPWGSADGSGPEQVMKLLNAVGEMTRLAQAEGYVLQAQPGRVICAGAYTLVSTVIGKANRNGRPWFYLSDGVYGAYNGVLYDHQPYLFLPVNRSIESLRENVSESVVCGPTCDGVDIMARDISLPEDLEVGEYLFSPDIGAYSMVAASQFNGFAQAPILSQANLEREILLHIEPTEPSELNLPLAV